MDKRDWSSGVLVRYVLVHLPGVVVLVLILILVRRWVDLSTWFLFGLVALWVAKDVALFPFVWRAYDRNDRPVDTNSMLGARGVVEDRLAPTGYVRVHGELWQAESTAGGPAIEGGEDVLVRGTRGLTLLVEASSDLRHDVSRRKSKRKGN